MLPDQQTTSLYVAFRTRRLIKTEKHKFRYWQTRRYWHGTATQNWCFVLINIVCYYDAHRCLCLFQSVTVWSSTACLSYHPTSVAYRNRNNVSYRRLKPVRYAHRLSDAFEVSARCRNNSIDLRKYFRQYYIRQSRAVFLSWRSAHHVVSRQEKKTFSLTFR